MSRGKSPSDNTVRMLCGKAAGMCEFEGCNKRLFYDNVTLTEFNNAFVAHIVASSANGPRGDKVLSPQLSDKLENLMLMCADHHKLIDTNVDEYPVERLKAMKVAHEEKLDRICSLFNVPKTEIVRFASPIKGTQAVDINYNLAAKAVLPDKHPASQYGILIPISSFYSYKSEDYWNDCVNQLQIQFQNVLYNPYIQLQKSEFSIFPIAPIPLIIKLGELIGDKLPCDIYQKTRVPDTWEWQSNELTNTFSIERKEYNDKSKNIALIISLTNEISNDRIPQIDEYRALYKITASELGVDCVKSILDLSDFWHTYQNVCEEILNFYGRDVRVHLFPATPVSAAFEIGRRYMTNTYPKISIYDECDGFFKTLVLGG
jgi:hypothetical protein